MGVELMTCESYELLFFTSLYQNTKMWESVTTRLPFTLIVNPKLGLVWLSNSAGISSSSLFMLSILESVLSQFPTVWELTNRCLELLYRFFSSPYRHHNGLASGLGFCFVVNLITGLWNPSVSWALSVGRNLTGLYYFSSTTLWTWILVGAMPFFV